VAHGDYNGDGNDDVAVLLPGISGKRLILAVALRTRTSWTVTQLPTWCDESGKGSEVGCFVSTEKPGTYHRTNLLDGPLEPGEASELTSKTDSVVSGRVEANAVVHVYTGNGRWRYVWTSD
jgi:hypothetical protein